MSLAAESGKTAAAESAESPMERSTYWCHECDMSVSLLASPQQPQPQQQQQPILCPQCFGDFLELMDSSSPNQSSHFSFPPSFPSLVDDDGDNYLHRLISHLTTRSSPSDSFSDDSDSSEPAAPLPASKSSIEAITTIRVPETDPSLLCAVCKDHFEVGVEAKQLPCKHFYHPDCILPWLAHHNSCPLCRFRLPAEQPSRDSFEVGFPEGVLRLGELMATGDEDWFDYASTLRYIARRHNLLFSPGNGGPASLSSSRVSEPETETEGRAGLSGGDGELGLSRGGNEEGGAAISGVKVSSSSVSEDLRFGLFS